MFGEFTFGKVDLAATTQSSAAAYRIDVDAEASGRLQYGRAKREVPAPAGRQKNNFGVLLSHLN